VHLVGLFPQTLRQARAGAEQASHTLLLRAGLVRTLGAGTFAWLPLGQRVWLRLQGLAREALDALGAREIALPLPVPAEALEPAGLPAPPAGLSLRDRAGRSLLWSQGLGQLLTCSSATTCARTAFCRSCSTCSATVSMRGSRRPACWAAGSPSSWRSPASSLTPGGPCPGTGGTRPGLRVDLPALLPGRRRCRDGGGAGGLSGLSFHPPPRSWGCSAGKTGVGRRTAWQKRG